MYQTTEDISTVKIPSRIKILEKLLGPKMDSPQHRTSQTTMHRQRCNTEERGFPKDDKKITAV
jgi:hypothetical protein